MLLNSCTISYYLYRSIGALLDVHIRISWRRTAMVSRAIVQEAGNVTAQISRIVKRLHSARMHGGEVARVVFWARNNTAAWLMGGYSL